MRRFLAAPVLALAFLLPAGAASADTKTVTTDGDAFVESASPTSNFGTSANLRVRLGVTYGEQQSFLRFPDPGVPAGSTGVSAKLHVYAKEINSKLVQARTAGDFNETGVNGITWNSKPALGAVASSQTVSSAGWKDFDVPVTVGSRNQYALTTTTNAESNLAFDAREGTLGDAQLVVTYTPPAVAQCADGADNDGDGLVDYPADPGCASATDNDETNIAPPPPPGDPVPASATLLSRTDFQDGTLGGWYKQCLTGRSSIPTDIDGNRYFRAEVRQGDVEPDTGNNRCMLNGPPSGSAGKASNGNYPNGEYWYRIRTRFIQGFPGNQWTVVQQWHESPGIGPVDLANFVEGSSGSPFMHLYGDHLSPGLTTSVVGQGSWHTYVLHLLLGSSGYSEEWVDNHYVGKAVGNTNETSTNYPGVGIYRAAATSSGTMISDTDDISIYKP